MTSAAALDEAVRVPLELCGLAAEVATWPPSWCGTANPRLRGDAATAGSSPRRRPGRRRSLVVENLADAPARPAAHHRRRHVAAAGAPTVLNPLAELARVDHSAMHGGGRGGAAGEEGGAEDGEG